MRIPYYPGCTLHQKASGLDRSARVTAAALGIELVELPQWQCCGGLIPQIREAYMGLLAPARILVDAQKEGDRLLTLCTFCYNTLKRADRILRDDPESRRRIEDFLEEKYYGVRVVHLLEVLRDEVGWDSVRQQVVRPLDWKVAPYYGCLLLRPYKEIGLDDPEDPTIMEDFLRCLGCTVVNFPAKTECCGSFLSVTKPELAKECSRQIVQKAAQTGAQVIVTTCPLCQFNLDRFQGDGPTSDGRYRSVPILYFTQPLAFALGLDEGVFFPDQHRVSPQRLFSSPTKEGRA
ncbi:MAG: CoB--CoM heterodisulfide reductase iron-sulfur subunit B family protein [Armatimonadetes bacterium]|nr:CoB--CoM heterodisulfide reductase iron-sulfur subunit B family protein [Armatimonadota bacterium]MDW8122324.1 CoB--CoM heterodisulfide reductase iron-sulfur subunit B family protein [Armatimonadota bacterium]